MPCFKSSNIRFGWQHKLVLDRVLHAQIGSLQFTFLWFARPTWWDIESSNIPDFQFCSQCFGLECSWCRNVSVAIFQWSPRAVSRKFCWNGF